MVERVDHDSLRENLGEKLRLGLAGSVEGVRGDSAAAQAGESLGNGFVVLGPVGAEEDNVGVGEGLADYRLGEDDALVDLTAETPAGCEVHEDGAPLRLIARYGLSGPRLPLALRGGLASW